MMDSMVGEKDHLIGDSRNLAEVGKEEVCSQSSDSLTPGSVGWWLVLKEW